MQYQGGKARLAKRIAEVVRAEGAGRPYLEPFVGGGSVLAAMDGWQSWRDASDYNRALVRMWQALQLGWEPPAEATREQWLHYRDHQDPHDPMTAFLGIGCSFMGMWFSSAAVQLAARTRQTLLAKAAMIRDVHFTWRPYWEHSPVDCVVYCDPPYAGTEGYAAVPGFDHTQFWETMRRWADDGSVVLVSEYSAPEGVDLRASWEIRGGMSRGAARRENLYVLRPPTR